MICTVEIATDDGVFTAGFSQMGLAELSFPDRRHALKSAGDVPKQWQEQAASALISVLSGREPDMLPPLDLSKGTPFQQKVWRALLEIRAGQTRSYGEMAAAVGAPGAARAVGAACGANPIPVIVPCHRVLAAQKKLGGFSAGLKWKRLLLEREASSRGMKLDFSGLSGLTFSNESGECARSQDTVLQTARVSREEQASDSYLPERRTCC